MIFGGRPPKRLDEVFAEPTGSHARHARDMMAVREAGAPRLSRAARPHWWRDLARGGRAWVRAVREWSDEQGGDR